MRDEYKIICEFLEFRINSDNYRGRHVSQHNRLDFEKVVGLIAAYKNVGVEFIEIPSGDEKQHKNAKGFNLLDYPNYGMFVKEVISNNSQGTANSIKKICYRI
jgi:hypothetical protein